MSDLLMTNLNSMEKSKENNHKTSYVNYKLYKREKGQDKKEVCASNSFLFESRENPDQTLDC